MMKEMRNIEKSSPNSLNKLYLDCDKSTDSSDSQGLDELEYSVSTGVPESNIYINNEEETCVSSLYSSWSTLWPGFDFGNFLDPTKEAVHNFFYATREKDETKTSENNDDDEYKRIE